MARDTSTWVMFSFPIDVTGLGGHAILQAAHALVLQDGVEHIDPQPDGCHSSVLIQFSGRRVLFSISLLSPIFPLLPLPSFVLFFSLRSDTALSLFSASLPTTPYRLTFGCSGDRVTAALTTQGFGLLVSIVPSFESTYSSLISCFI